MMKKLLWMLMFCGCAQVAFAQTSDNTNAAQKQAPAANTTNTPANPDLKITGAYVQPLIPGQKNTAAYMTISNTTDRTYVLTGADSPIAASTQLHTVLMQDGIMHMRDVDAITLLPGQQVILQPGDFHVMLMGVETELNKDTLVPICLEFKDTDVMCINVPVEDKRGSGAVDNKQSHDHAGH